MSSLTKRAFNNIFWLCISEICAKGSIFLVTIYLARILGVEGFGKFSLALSVSMYMWIVVDMGVTTYGTREVARYRDNVSELLNILNSIRLVIAAVSFLILLIVLLIIDVPLDTKFILIAGGFYVVAYAVSPDWVLCGIERMEYVALSNGIIAALFLSAVFLFVKSPQDSAAALFYRSISFLIGSITTIVIIKKKIGIKFSFKISLTEWWLHVRESIYFAVNLGFNSIAVYIPVFFLWLWFTMEDIGIFSASQRVVILLMNAASVVPMALFPMLSNLYVSDRDKFYKLHKSFEKIVLYIGLPIGVIGMLMSKNIVTTLYGNIYAASSTVFGIMIWLVPLMFLRTNYGRTLASAGFHRFNMFATGSGAVVSVLLCIILIPLYGNVGAAISIIGGELVILLFMGLMFGMKLYHSNPLDLYFIKVVLVSIVTGIIVAEVGLSMIYSIIIGALIYGGVSMIIGLITMEMIRDVFHKIVQKRLR